MKALREGLTVIGFFLLCWVVLAREANAYIDPSTGSYLLQILLAGFLGALFTLKIFWKNVKTFVADKFRKNSDGKNRTA
jgi:hypothetical protein